MRIFTLLLLSSLPLIITAGFQPVDRDKLLHAIYGRPCDCSGGITKTRVDRYLSKTDCGDKTAYLHITSSITGGTSQSWVCLQKPVLVASGEQCPSNCQFLSEMHASCYLSFSKCRHNGIDYFTAVSVARRLGSVGGDWGTVPRAIGSTKYATASCAANAGATVCWPVIGPIHSSDDGPNDQVRATIVEKKIEAIIQAQVPTIRYNPLPPPRAKPLDLDPRLEQLLSSTLSALNSSNPKLAADCWLCPALGNSWPLALPVNLTGPYNGSTCSLLPPFMVMPVSLPPIQCLVSPPSNLSLEIPLGQATEGNCSVTFSYDGDMLCPPQGYVFVCGGNRAYPFLPRNWTGSCFPAILLPDIEILPGDAPIPLPSFDTLVYRAKRAVQFIPLLVGLGVAGALATGSTGVGVAIHTYTALSQRIADDVQTVYQSVKDIQDQLDSLAEVVLQNRRGLDLLTADKGGICVVLQEKCCFYANKSGIVRDRIRKHQAELLQRRKALFENPFWSMWNGILPYLLPLLGPLVSLLLIVTIGPCIVNRLFAYVRSQIQRLGALQVYYHKLATEEYT